jgi:hypothetical protein
LKNKERERRKLEIFTKYSKQEKNERKYIASISLFVNLKKKKAVP